MVWWMCCIYCYLSNWAGWEGNFCTFCSSRCSAHLFNFPFTLFAVEMWNTANDCFWPDLLNWKGGIKGDSQCLHDAASSLKETASWCGCISHYKSIFYSLHPINNYQVFTLEIKIKNFSTLKSLACPTKAAVYTVQTLRCQLNLRPPGHCHYTMHNSSSRCLVSESHSWMNAALKLNHVEMKGD